MKKKKLVCPICKSNMTETYMKGNLKIDELKETDIKITDSQYGKFWDLWLCKNCGYIFSSLNPYKDYIYTLYKKVEDPLYDEEAENRSLNFIRILSFLEKIKPQKGKLFDVGSATGILLNIAKQRGWEVDGIEPSSWAVNYALSKYKISIKKGIFEEHELPSDYYDVVTMIDLIEHIPNPEDGIKKANFILKRGGILCIVTPDIKSFVARILGKKWWHLRPAHLSYFSKKSLRYLLEKNRFEILKERYYVWTFSVNYLLSRKKYLNFLLKSKKIASFSKKIRIKLALRDSLELYAVKR